MRWISAPPSCSPSAAPHAACDGASTCSACWWWPGPPRVAGGIARDLLIGAVPPAAIADWRYLAAAVAAGLLGFFASDLIGRLRTPVLLFDAAGLCLFAVTGTQKALAYGLNPAMAAILGMITCIGGGVARDLLTLQVPTVLRAELYAVAALAGAGSISLGFILGLPTRAGRPCSGPGCAFSCG